VTLRKRSYPDMPLPGQFPKGLCPWRTQGRALRVLVPPPLRGGPPKKVAKATSLTLAFAYPLAAGQRFRTNLNRINHERNKTMQLSNGTNSIDERRYRIISDAMQRLHCEDIDFLSSMIAQGRSEYSMDDLFRKQAAERAELEEHRRTLSIAQWVKLYPVFL
jgi:hypothetical protein